MLLVGAGPKKKLNFLKGPGATREHYFGHHQKKMESFIISTIQSGMSIEQ